MNRKEPKVLFFTKSDLSGQSGHNIATKEIVTAFAKNESIRTSLVCPEPRNDSISIDQIDDFFYLKSRGPEMSIPERLSGVVDSYLTLRNAILETNPDVIIARTSPIIISPPILAELNDIPYLVLSRGTGYKTLRFNQILSKIYKLNVCLGNGVYVASEEIKQDTERIIHGDPSKVHLLPNAVNPDIFKPIPKQKAWSEIGLDSDPGFTVGFVGSMKEYHRIDSLLEAASLIKPDIEISLLLIGDGPELDKYRKLAQKKGVEDDVIFTGFIDHSDVNTYLSACDVLFGVSDQESATPVKIFEYLSCKRPVIARDIAELDFINEFNLGETVARPDPGLIADSLRELYSVGEKSRIKMGERGREYVINERTWEKFVEDIVEDQLEKAGGE